MGFSSLVADVVMASGSNYTSGRNGYSICKFTPHHMAGKLTGAQCARLFQDEGRGASANYCIGYDGEIVGCVDEEDRAWTSSSRSNDFQAITVEVSNDVYGGDWTISNASWNALVKLAVDVCQRYGFRLVYDGTPNGSLTRHNMFANTNCPGPYLQSRFDELASVVNAILDGSPAPIPQPVPPSVSEYTVNVTADCLNVREAPGTNFSIIDQITDHGTYTIIKESTGPGASLWGKLKSNGGWIALDYTSKNADNSSGGYTSTHKLGLYVVNTPSGLNVRKGPGTNYNIIKAYRNGTRFDTYEISGDWARTPSGWVNLRYCSLVRAY